MNSAGSRGVPPEFVIRPAKESDAEMIAAAHLDSIRSLGPRSYPAEIVREWSAHVAATMYTAAMARGERFFVAVPHERPHAEVLGFSSTGGSHGKHRIAVYVRGSVARLGLGSALFREAEREARAHGATVIDIDASLAAVEFYGANGFESLGQGDHRLPSGRRMACVFMRKRLTPLDMSTGGMSGHA